MENKTVLEKTEVEKIMSELDPALYVFLDSCLFARGLKNLDLETKNSLIAQLSLQLQAWLMQSTIKALSEADLANFEALLQSGTDAQSVQQFLQRRIANYESMYTQSLQEFKQAYVA